MNLFLAETRDERLHGLHRGEQVGLAAGGWLRWRSQVALGGLGLPPSGLPLALWFPAALGFPLLELALHRREVGLLHLDPELAADEVDAVTRAIEAGRKGLPHGV